MNWQRLARRLTLVGLDAVLAAGAFLLAYQLRLGYALTDFPEYVSQYLHLVAWVVALHLGLFFLFDLYRGVARFAGLRELMAIAAAATVSALALLLYNLIRERVLDLGRIPRSVIPLTWLLAIAFAGGARFLRRMAAEGRLWPRPKGRGVLIVGAGERGELVARELMRRRPAGRVPVGFIDENPDLRGRLIHGLEIFGGLDRIDEVLKDSGAEEIIVALPVPSPRQMKEIADRCRHRHVSIQRLPSAEEVLDGRVALERLRPVRIEDLLEREPVRLTLSPQENYLRGERVLVTGAGGSIGSELCRQILPCGPQRLLLLGRGENSLMEIAAALGFRFGDERMELILADIQDERKMAQVFQRHRPTVVFHAAAHKHVPFGEIAPEEIVRNNVFGTLNVARESIAVGVKRFILISTDKAVRPSNVLGASKRVAEMAVAALGEGSGTEFMSVRFGNVLGSRGSVVPLFLRQIEAGGPLTVTDPDMTRYFMTIPEAASLVLQAGAIGRGGQLLVLDMGEPVRIADLARNMITLAGYEPDVDIEIQTIGARPGEKIHEELLTDQEGLEKTRYGKIFVTQSQRPDRAALERELEPLRQQVLAGHALGVRTALQRLVADFSPGGGGHGA